MMSDGASEWWFKADFHVRINSNLKYFIGRFICIITSELLMFDKVV